MDYVNAFWVGGLICAPAQILMEKLNDAWANYGFISLSWSCY